MLEPDWQAPSAVRAFATLRPGGVSVGPWGLRGGGAGGMNLGARCGDDPVHVDANRARLRACLPADPLWLNQVHGITVFDADAEAGAATPIDAEPMADASVTTRRGRVLAVLTADCIPVLMCDEDATVVAAAHAGWRGLAAGVLEATVARMRSARPQAGAIYAWLGPAIGPRAFEVGQDVRQAFCDRDASCVDAFVAASSPGKWMADLFALARRRLRHMGVMQIAGGDQCTSSSPERFYSHRRDRVTGRMASVIWLG